MASRVVGCTAASKRFIRFTTKHIVCRRMLCSLNRSISHTVLTGALYNVPRLAYSYTKDVQYLCTARKHSGLSRARWPEPRRAESPEDGDEYRWMQDADSEEVLLHLQEENEYSAATLKPLHRRANELYRCMLARQPEGEGGDDRSVPERLGPFLYYTRRDEGSAYPLYVRRPVEGELLDEEVVLDLNAIESWQQLCSNGGRDEESRPPLRLGSMKLSSDQRMLACTIDLEANDTFILVVFDLNSGTSTMGQGTGAARSETGSVPLSCRDDDSMWADIIGVEWGSQSHSEDGSITYELYYTVPDELRRPWQVRRALLRPTSTPPSSSESSSQWFSSYRCDDEQEGLGHVEPALDKCSLNWRVGAEAVVFEELDDAFFVDVGKTKDRQFIVINVHSKTTSEVLLLPAATSVGDCSVIPANSHSRDRASSTSGELVRPNEKLTLLRRRQQGVEYYVDHCGDSFYVVTNSPTLEGASDRGASKAPTSLRESRGDGEGPPGNVGEYRLIQIQQPGGSSSLEGIGDVPWKAVSTCRDFEISSSVSNGNAPSNLEHEANVFTQRSETRDGGNSQGRCTGDGAISTTSGGGSESSTGGFGCGTIEEMDVFREHCVLYELSPVGSPQIRVIPIRHPSSAFQISLPAPGGGTENAGSAPTMRSLGSARAAVLRPGVNAWFENRKVRFSLSSPIAPEDVYDLCLDSGTLELLRRTEVPGHPAFGGDISCYRVEVASRHGERVPLTIAHRAGLALNGDNRLLLHGYGAYGMSLPIDFHPSYACMVERDWVLAFAHVRGGGEKGRAWHAAGRGMDKWNSFWDLEACAEHLVSEGYTRPARIGLYTSSAGGLLAGVMANTRPDLFAAMVMKAPFLGVMSAMGDTSLPLTVHEFDEWGNPSAGEPWEAMLRSYCPYENVRRHAYPALLVTASVNDTRVKVWDPAKWVARVRAANTGDAPVLLRVSDSDGHDGPGDVHDSLKDSAMEMAFLERHLGGA